MSSCKINNLSKSNLSKSMHICSLFDGVKLNDFNEFLIVLNDYYYQWICLIPNEYDIIMSQKHNFPGKLHIKYESQIRDDISGNYNIKGIVQFKTLYIKLPKENIYVDSLKFQEELFESKFNELLNIFACLNARYVDFYFQNMDKYIEIFSTSVSTSASLSKVEGGESILSNHKTQSKRRIRAEYSDKTNTPFDPEKFKDKKTFYYLPKEHGWRNVIKNRLENKMLTQEYLYKYSESSVFSAEFYNCLRRLNIKFHYSSEKYNEIKIEYFIEYWPNKPVEPDHLRFSKCMVEATAETNMADFERRMEFILEKRERERKNKELKDRIAEEKYEYEESPFLLLRLFSYLNPMNMFYTDNTDNIDL